MRKPYLYPMSPHLILIALYCCAGVLAAAAQSPLRFTPVFRNYTTTQGLPSNEVFAIEQDRQGYIWFGTNNGVCRYNGYTFERFPDTLQTNYASVLTENLMEDACGRMWWADFRGRLFYHENGRIVPWAHNDTLAKIRDKFDFISSMVIEGCGEQVWLNLRFFGLFHARADGRWEVLTAPEQAAFHYIERGGRSMAVLQNVIGYDEPLSSSIYFEPYRTYSGKLYPDETKTHRWSILPLGQDRHLVASPGFGAILFYKGIPQQRMPYGLELNTLYIAPDSSLLLGHIGGGGVRRYRSLDDLWAGKPELAFLEGLSVNKILRDREGGYWFCTQEQGVFYSPGLETAVLQGLPGLQGQVATGVAAAPNGLLYLGIRNGKVFELDTRRMQGRDISPGNMTYLNTLYFDPAEGLLIAAGVMSGFYRQGRWESEFFQPYHQKRRYKSGFRYTKTAEPHRWWDAAPSSFSLLDVEGQREIYNYALDKKVLGIRFFSIGLAAGGTPYVSTQQGLWAFRNGDLERPSPMYPVFLQPAEDMLLLPDSTLALATRGSGVVFWKPGSAAPPRIIGEEQGLVFNRVSRLYLEPGGALWACTELGAGRISPDRSSVENYTVQTGLPSSLVHQVDLSDGYYWLATSAGLVRMQARPAPAPMPRPVIEHLIVNGEDYSPGSIAFPHDSANIRIEWAALRFRSMGQILYRYRLRSGSEDDAWTQGMQTSISFSGLPPGAYTFEVQAQDEDGRWSETGSLSLRIRPPWWQTPLFRGTVLLALAGLGFGYYKYRTRQLKRAFAIKQQMFELERSALQAQMNPHFIFNCLNSIQGFITANDKDRAATFLAQFARLIRQTLEHSFQKEITLEEEVAYLNNYLSLEHLRFRDAFRYEIQVDESLDAYETVLPSMLVQPFVENAIVHGMKGKTGDGWVRVHFEAFQTGLRVTVEDNGPGMAHNGDENPDKGKAKSYGTQLAHRRLALTAQYPNASIRSTAGAEGGTRVEITLV